MTTLWTLPPLGVGEFAPLFDAPTRTNRHYHFSTLAGRYVLLAFMPTDRPARDAALAAFEPHRALFDDRNLTAFFVSPLPEAETPPDRTPGQRWFLDGEGAVARLYGVGEGGPAWFLLDPNLRVLDTAALDGAEALFRRIAALPPSARHAGVETVAPVLIVPRVFEPEFCRQLIAAYDADGGADSGVMRDIDGRTVGVMDPMKRRRDMMVTDPEVRKAVVQRIERALLPMIRRAFQYEATRIERYLVACYDAREGGWFGAHRDNETLGTAHRRFAVSINLDAEAFEGGDLRFPEFGPRLYRPPTGGAVVFSCSLQHEATPVSRGRRYAFLPFLYDEAGQKVREKNLAFMESRAADAPVR